MRIISLVGLKKCGKTTTAEALIREFKSRGLIVCAVKFMPNSIFTIDVEGKDTFRQFSAGADMVISLSDGQVACIERVEGRTGLEDVLSRVSVEKIDVLLCEGLMADDPRIEYVVLARSGALLTETFSVRGRPERIVAFSGIMANGHAVDAEIDGVPLLNATDVNEVPRLADLLLSSP